MIYFAFLDHGEAGDASMALLHATAPEPAMEEARDTLRASPGSASAHVFDGDRFVGSVDAPAFGFAGTNNTDGFEGAALSGDRAAAPGRTGGPASVAAA
ncbi:hypothetical protein [Brevundimonas goettingensis]|uniref:Uncharacterized protein n=1 Tax=Brevundimonas goettingensis TaxID=2774190 RepID=A0A975GXH0_9CAUL|nr:hypothetical protein [Brevundimonas goettingensis]QTC92874.1 hypothetical protein IFJ75_08530 [Brevundimonas goettingensis]